MKSKSRKYFLIGTVIFTAFILWTLAVLFFDVQEIGPNNSAVGFASLNRFFHNLTGVNMQLYVITDWAGLVPFCFMFGFGILGLFQWTTRQNILKVDNSILILGVFYIIILSLYIFFEICIVNFRPILINGRLEASYPSSTTLLTGCVLPTAVTELSFRIKNNKLRKCVTFVLYAFTAFTVVGRFISGVHWFTDIFGGILLSSGLVLIYRAVIYKKRNEA